ncbi:MAG: hypothetical protein ACI9SX_000384 [Pseudoalteromonas tetraodonis]
MFGLPGESFESFSDSFDQLYELKPHEIQVGILKRLKGSPIIRHTDEHQLVFNPNPPFAIVSSSTADYKKIQEISRFARYWDLIGNSGRFKNSLALLMGGQPFDRFFLLSQELFKRSQQTHKISLLRLYDFVFDIGQETMEIDAQLLRESIAIDHQLSGLKSSPKCLRSIDSDGKVSKLSSSKSSRALRQSRH